MYDPEAHFSRFNSLGELSSRIIHIYVRFTATFDALATAGCDGSTPVVTIEGVFRTN